jgi:CheY-like chemotaxis protein
MLVEDDKVNQMVIQKYLSRLGFQITTVENGLEAVSEFKKQQFDIILMDIQMPLMDGYKATSIIRAIEMDQGTHIPIIALTAYAMSKDRDKCLEAGMDDYISKPIDLGLLMITIKKWIEN